MGLAEFWFAISSPSVLHPVHLRVLPRLPTLHIYGVHTEEKKDLCRPNDAGAWTWRASTGKQALRVPQTVLAPVLSVSATVLLVDPGYSSAEASHMFCGRGIAGERHIPAMLRLADYVCVIYSAGVVSSVHGNTRESHTAYQ